MTIFEALRQDHVTQRTLLDLLIRTEGDSEGRRELFDRARKELERHAAAEERSFYVPLMEFDRTQEKARHSVAEHHEIDELIETLEDTDPSSPGWLSHAKKLHEVVHHHLDEEEQEVFPLADEVLDEARGRELGARYRDEMRERR